MFRKYCSTAIVTIIEGDLGINLRVYSLKNSQVLAKYDRNYQEPNQAKRFLEQIIENHYFCYVAQLFKSIGQGVLPSKDKRDLIKYGIDPTNIGLIDLGGFYLYASKSEIKHASECCGNLLASDLLYSPFSLLHSQVRKKPARGCNLYMLKHKNLITIMVYEDKIAKFGNYFELKIAQIPQSSDGDNPVIEDLEIEEHDDFEELTFDDLDNIDESISDEEIAKLDLDNELSDETNSLANFDTEMAIYDYLKTAIKEFYDNPLYESDFIENIYIFESETSSLAFLTMIKTELLINPSVHKIDLFYEIFIHACSDLGIKHDS